VTDQNSQDTPARLEILPAERYARTRAYVDDTTPVDLEPAKIVVDRGDQAAPTAAIEPSSPTAADPDEEAEVVARNRPPYYPLRRRAANIRDAKHSEYDDATSPGEGLAVAYRYAWSVLACSSQRGMHHQPTEDALVEVGRTLMAVADAHTDAMRVWRPES
jgi:hypothetical protein